MSGHGIARSYTANDVDSLVSFLSKGGLATSFRPFRFVGPSLFRPIQGFSQSVLAPFAGLPIKTLPLGKFSDVTARLTFGASASKLPGVGYTTPFLPGAVVFVGLGHFIADPNWLYLSFLCDWFGILNMQFTFSTKWGPWLLLASSQKSYIESRSFLE